MAQGTVRAAIVGYGLAGRIFHGQLLAAAGARISAVVTRDPRRREQVARDHPGAVAVDDVEAALAAADLLVVASPNAHHAEAASAALTAGVPVVVDKPLAVTAAEARRLVEQARRTGVPLTVFHNRRWDSDQLTLRRLIAAGELGAVTRYESRFERWRPRLTPGKWRETLSAAAGGGLLLDLGTHLVDQARQLFGPVTEVYAELDSRRPGDREGPADATAAGATAADATGGDGTFAGGSPGEGPEDDVFLALRHAGGSRSHLWASAVSAAPGPRLRVLGDAGAYLIEQLDSQENALRAGRRPMPGQPWGVAPPEHAGQLRRGAEARPVPSEPGRWDTFYPAVLEAVRGRGPMPVDPHDAVAVLELLEAARRAAARRTVEIITG